MPRGKCGKNGTPSSIPPAPDPGVSPRRQVVLAHAENIGMATLGNLFRIGEIDVALFLLYFDQHIRISTHVYQQL
jgi:hypothetical protein